MVVDIEMLDTAEEIVLDFIVERKRLDDLAGSIKDGRFREQKVWTFGGDSEVAIR